MINQYINYKKNRKIIEQVKIYKCNSYKVNKLKRIKLYK